MRTWNLTIRSLLGAAALSTVAACHDADRGVACSSPISVLPTAEVVHLAIAPTMPAATPAVTEELTIVDEEEVEPSTERSS